MNIDENVTSRAQNMQEELDSMGLTSLVKDREAFNKRLLRMTFDECKNGLVFLNGFLREIPEAEHGFHSAPMYVRGQRLATPEVQASVLESGFNAIKSIKNDKHRATLAFYLINLLHMFSDGNGRTSRIIFDILNSNNLDIVSNYEYYLHTEPGQNGTYIKGDFGIQRGIDENFVRIDEISSLFLSNDLLASGLINRKGSIPKYGYRAVNGNVIGVYSIYISEHIKEEFSESEIKYISESVTSRTGGLAMLIMQTQKGNMDTCDKIREESYGYQSSGFLQNAYTLYVDTDSDFSDSQNDMIRESFANWTREDYIRMADITNELEELRLEKIIDFFVNPQGYKMEDGESVADFLSNYTEDRIYKRVSTDLIVLNEENNDKFDIDEAEYE